MSGARLYNVSTILQWIQEIDFCSVQPNQRIYIFDACDAANCAYFSNFIAHNAANCASFNAHDAANCASFNAHDAADCASFSNFTKHYTADLVNFEMY